MEPELIVIPEEQLFNYLVNLDFPVMEHELIKKMLLPETCSGEKPTLFVKHFSLYHALYKLKFSAGSEGFYLHLDCMRIRLIHIPPAGVCRHYDAESGKFCGADTHGEYCELHDADYTQYRDSVIFDYLQDFYCDSDNITFGESELLRKIMRGIRVYSLKRRDIEMALDFFGLRKPAKKNITRRYRELAGKYHPDRCGGSEEMMKRLNSSYMILKDVFVV